jgi:hypothetical protein
VFGFGRRIDPKPLGLILASREKIRPSAGNSCRRLFCCRNCVMREDMYKVIVERPRRGKDGNVAAARLRNNFNGPTRLRARAGYGYRSLNENLTPLRRFCALRLGGLGTRFLAKSAPTLIGATPCSSISTSTFETLSLSTSVFAKVNGLTSQIAGDFCRATLECTRSCMLIRAQDWSG